MKIKLSKKNTIQAFAVFFALFFFTPLGYSKENISIDHKSSQKFSKLKETFWVLGIGGEKHTYKSGEGFEMLGNSGSYFLGYGKQSERWFLSSTAEMLVGPFDANQSAHETNYNGTRVNLWWGYSAQELDLRHPQGGYGFTIGINYADLVGRSIVTRATKVVPSHSSQIGESIERKIALTSLAFSPGIFFCWMEPARTEGHKFENLKTRIEGYIFSLAISFPVYSRYHLNDFSWQLRDPGAFENNDQDDGFDVSAEHWKEGHESKRGKLNGYSFLISLQTLIGA